MGEQLEVTVKSTNQKVQFSGVSRDNAPITIDYTPPLGDGQGYTSLELLLVSLATCSASTIVTLLRRQFVKTVSATEVRARGVRRTEHPTSFESISLDFTFHSPDLKGEDVDKAIQISRDAVCPVWAMVKGNVEVFVDYEISVS